MRRRLWIVAVLALLLLRARPAWAVVTVCNTGVTVGGTAAASLTVSFNATGCDLILLGVSQWRASDLAPTATFNTVQNFTDFSHPSIADGSGFRRATIFRLVNPNQTTANIVVSWVGSVDEAVIGATGWTGVDQTTPLGAAVTATSAGGVDTLSVDVTAAIGGFTHDTYSGSADSTLFSATNQTLRWRQWAAMATSEGGGASASGTGSAVTHTWSMIGQGGALGAIRIVLIGVPINAAAAGGTGGNRVLLLGVGR